MAGISKSSLSYSLLDSNPIIDN